MRIIAHRGWSGKYPENTMLAFKKAIEAGADGIELDVHLSKDKEVMIIHDEALLRTAGLPGCVSDYTRSELEAISAGKTKNDEFGFTPIPSLEEYLDYVSKTNAITNIELKTAPIYYPGIEKKVCDLVHKFSYGDRTIFSSFNPLSIMEIKKHDRAIPCGFLVDGISIKNVAVLINSLGIECYHPRYTLINEEVLLDCKSNSVALNVWTVNEREDIKKCIEWGIDGLITNHPDLALELRG